MARRIDPRDLVGAAEVAERIGLRRPQAIHNWRTRYADFPAPVAELKQGLVWDWTEVRSWAIKTGRLGSDGRPKR